MDNCFQLRLFYHVEADESVVGVQVPRSLVPPLKRGGKVGGIAIHFFRDSGRQCVDLLEREACSSGEQVRVDQSQSLKPEAPAVFLVFLHCSQLGSSENRLQCGVPEFCGRGIGGASQSRVPHFVDPLGNGGGVYCILKVFADVFVEAEDPVGAFKFGGASSRYFESRPPCFVEIGDGCSTVQASLIAFLGFGLEALSGLENVGAQGGFQEFFRAPGRWD